MEKYQEELIKVIIDKALEKTAQGLKRIIKDTWEKFRTDYQLVFSEYYKSAYEKYSKAKTIIYRTEPRPLIGPDGFFEEPYFIKGYRDAYVQNDDELKNKTLVKGIDTIISLKTNCVLFQGTGGIGKSTLMKYLFLNALDDKGYIPVFVELRELNDLNDDYNLDDLFFSKMGNLGSALNEDYMERTLLSGTYIFLLDGYDEVLIEKRRDFIKKLEDFIGKYRENYFIMSSRPFSSFMELERFTILSLCPFTKEQAISRIRKLQYDTVIKERFICALENEKLYEKHKDFASNPLLLCIMLLTYENYAGIPDKLHVFYSEVFDTMFQRHDAVNSLYKRPIKSKLSYDEFKKAFASFCFYTYIQGKTSAITREEIKEAFQKLKYDFDVDDFIDDLKNVLCFLIQDGNKYFFSHRSFQEYFTAWYLKELDDTRMTKCGLLMLKSNPDGFLSDKVFPMLSDMSRERFIKNILLSGMKDLLNANRKDTIKRFLKAIDGLIVLNSNYYMYEKQVFPYLLDLIPGDLGRLHENNTNWLISYYLIFVHRHFMQHKIKPNNTPNPNANNETREFVKAAFGKEKYKKFVDCSISQIEITYDVLNSSDEALDAFMGSWIGRTILKCIDLYEETIKAEKENAALLDALLG